MRNAGAARRHQEREPSPPPDAAEIIARLERCAAETEALIAAMKRQSGLGPVQVIEMISLAAHCAELRGEAERLAALVPSRASAYAAGREDGLREAAELAAQAHPAPGRHAARKRHLKVAGSLAATGTVAASLAVGGVAVVASQDTAAAHHWDPRPAAVRLHAARPDTAVLVPQSPFSSARPSAAAASARPAPVVTARPVVPVRTPAPSPSPSVTATAAPALDVPRLLNLGGSILGQLTLTAGAQAVEWTATTTDGIRLSSYSGVAVAGQPVVLQVTDGPARGGWVYVSFGSVTVPVEVTTDLAPVLALP